MVTYVKAIPEHLISSMAKEIPKPADGKAFIPANRKFFDPTTGLVFRSNGYGYFEGDITDPNGCLLILREWPGHPLCECEARKLGIAAIYELCQFAFAKNFPASAVLDECTRRGATFVRLDDYSFVSDPGDMVVIDALNFDQRMFDEVQELITRRWGRGLDLTRLNETELNQAKLRLQQALTNKTKPKKEEVMAEEKKSIQERWTQIVRQTRAAGMPHAKLEELLERTCKDMKVEIGLTEFNIDTFEKHVAEELKLISYQNEESVPAIPTPPASEKESVKKKECACEKRGIHGLLCRCDSTCNYCIAYQRPADAPKLEHVPFETPPLPELGGIEQAQDEDDNSGSLNENSEASKAPDEVDLTAWNNHPLIGWQYDSDLKGITIFQVGSTEKRQRLTYNQFEKACEHFSNCSEENALYPLLMFLKEQCARPEAYASGTLAHRESEGVTEEGVKAFLALNPGKLNRPKTSDSPSHDAVIKSVQKTTEQVAAVADQLEALNEKLEAEEETEEVDAKAGKAKRKSTKTKSTTPKAAPEEPMEVVRQVETDPLANRVVHHATYGNETTFNEASRKRFFLECEMDSIKEELASFEAEAKARMAEVKNKITSWEVNYGAELSAIVADQFRKNRRETRDENGKVIEVKYRPATIKTRFGKYSRQPVQAAKIANEAKLLDWALHLPEEERPLYGDVIRVEIKVDKDKAIEFVADGGAPIPGVERCTADEVGTPKLSFSKPKRKKETEKDGSEEVSEDAMEVVEDEEGVA